jgi:hypothetical protein
MLTTQYLKPLTWRCCSSWVLEFSLRMIHRSTLCRSQCSSTCPTVILHSTAKFLTATGAQMLWRTLQSWAIALSTCRCACSPTNPAALHADARKRTSGVSRNAHSSYQEMSTCPETRNLWAQDRWSTPTFKRRVGKPTRVLPLVDHSVVTEHKLQGSSSFAVSTAFNDTSLHWFNKERLQAASELFRA